MDSYDCDRLDAALALTRALCEDNYPIEIVKGLQTIADAMIDTAGFEPTFQDCVEKAKEHSRAAYLGYNLPAKVAA
jgi:hypothetical protein